MNTIQVCRMCLAHDTRMYTIAYEPLQKFYEKITGKVFKMDSARLSVLCYICYHLLKKCHKFTESAIKADEVLQQICKSGIQISKEFISVKGNPLLCMAYKISPVTIINIEEVSKVKSEEGKDSPDVNWTSSEQQRIVVTEIHEDKIIADAHIKKETDLDVTCKEEDVLCSENLVSQDHHGSDTHGDDTEDVKNGSILAKVKEEDTFTIEVLEHILHHHNPVSDKDVLLDDVGLDEENGDDDRTSMLEKYGPENKDALAKPCAVVLRRDERIERMLQETQFPLCVRRRLRYQDATTLPEDISQGYEMEYEIKTEKIEIEDTEFQTSFSSESDDDVQLKRFCKEIDDTDAKDASNPNDDGRGNKGIPGPRNRKLDQTIQYPESLRVQASSRENTDAEKKIEIETNNWSDNGHTQLYLTRKTDCEKRYDQSNDKSVKRFTCNHCGKKFTRISNMKSHLRIHADVNPFTCSHCGKKLSSKRGLEQHLSIHTGEKPFTCSHCGKKMSSKYGLVCHLRTHTDENPFTCNHCGKKVSSRRALENHLRIHTGEKPFTCSHCGKKVSSKRNLEYHLRKHTGENPFTCSHCGKKISTKYGLDRHVRIHTDEKPFTCIHCGKKLITKEGFEYHLKIHTGEKPFTCSHCGKKISTKQGLECHLRIHTGEKPFKCDLCQKEFTAKSNLNSHVQCIHTGEKPFTCSHCGKKISSKSILKNHLSKHTGEKLFTCIHCGKNMSSKHGLERHLRIHTGEKPFTCSHCGKKFSTKCVLKYHLRNHTGEKPFTCSHCGKKISTKQGLERHLRIHTGEKPYTCCHCGKKFSSKCVLKYHLRKHTGEKLFTCSHCEIKITTKQGLERHILRRHT